MVTLTTYLGVFSSLHARVLMKFNVSGLPHGRRAPFGSSGLV